MTSWRSVVRNHHRPPISRRSRPSSEFNAVAGVGFISQPEAPPLSLSGFETTIAHQSQENRPSSELNAAAKPDSGRQPDAPPPSLKTDIFQHFSTVTACVGVVGPIESPSRAAKGRRLPLRGLFLFGRILESQFQNAFGATRRSTLPRFESLARTASKRA